MPLTDRAKNTPMGRVLFFIAYDKGTLGTMKYAFIAYQWLTRLLCVLLLIQSFSVAASWTQMAGGRAQSVGDVFLPDGDNVTVEVWVKNLEVPWSLVSLSHFGTIQD